MVVGKEAFTKIVRFLKTDPKARYQGYKFYFREGFCWNNVLNPEARLLKVRIKGASVNDVGSMSLIPYEQMPSSKFFAAILNSNLLFDFYREFINCSVNIQINDIRQLPVVIPTPAQQSTLESLVNKAIRYRKQLEDKGDRVAVNNQLRAIEDEIDSLVAALYSKKRSLN
ncbi:hypothetical protein [uncultured Parasutterella sp.]|uniref:hypothetical protein n=1 Tax=Parasutterella sp. TaxID=2049037 RepID=UPI0025EDF6C7|nr:hypothetical protein [uncultured Parasutterella sp.]